MFTKSPDSEIDWTSKDLDVFAKILSIDATLKSWNNPSELEIHNINIIPVTIAELKYLAPDKNYFSEKINSIVFLWNAIKEHSNIEINNQLIILENNGYSLIGFLNEIFGSIQPDAVDIDESKTIHKEIPPYERPKCRYCTQPLDVYEKEFALTFRKQSSLLYIKLFVRLQIISHYEELSSDNDYNIFSKLPEIKVISVTPVTLPTAPSLFLDGGYSYNNNCEFRNVIEHVHFGNNKMFTISEADEINQLLVPLGFQCRKSGFYDYQIELTCFKPIPPTDSRLGNCNPFQGRLSFSPIDLKNNTSVDDQPKLTESGSFIKQKVTLELGVDYEREGLVYSKNTDGIVQVQFYAPNHRERAYTSTYPFTFDYKNSRFINLNFHDRFLDLKNKSMLPLKIWFWNYLEYDIKYEFTHD